MMSKHKGNQSADPTGRALSLHFNPYTTHAVATVSVEWRDGAVRRSTHLGRFHLHVTRADLAGQPLHSVVAILVDSLLRRLEPNGLRDPADVTAVGPGAPLGATGGTVINVPLPGL